VRTARAVEFDTIGIYKEVRGQVVLSRKEFACRETRVANRGGYLFNFQSRTRDPGFEKYGVRFLSPDEVAEQMPLYFAALNEKPQKMLSHCT
jgi:hypothetical protein